MYEIQLLENEECDSGKGSVKLTVVMSLVFS